MNLPFADLREIRTKASRYRACDEPEEHLWAAFGEAPFVLIVLCSKCGRTPLEMLAEMRINP